MNGSRYCPEPVTAVEPGAAVDAADGSTDPSRAPGPSGASGRPGDRSKPSSSITAPLTAPPAIRAPLFASPPVRDGSLRARWSTSARAEPRVPAVRSFDADDRTRSATLFGFYASRFAGTVGAHEAPFRKIPGGSGRPRDVPFGRRPLRSYVSSVFRSNRSASFWSDSSRFPRSTIVLSIGRHLASARAFNAYRR